MTARGRHTLGVALLSGVLVMVLGAAVWASTRGTGPGSSADAAATGAAGPTATGPGGDAGTPGASGGSAPGTSASSSGSASAGLRTHAATQPATSTPADDANRLRTLPSGTRQLVLVTTDSFSSNTARLATFTRSGDRWVPAFPAMQARIGSAGFADRKVEGDLKTPTGVYSIGGTMYGIQPNPGVRYGYHRVVEDDWWNENPATSGYNTFEHGPNPGGASEALWTFTPQYRYFAVVNYNIPVVSASPPRGSGIFLHVVNPGKATAGCVSLAEQDLLTVLRWLDPASAPRMVLAPRTVLNRY
ncbi:L,D-transpeptidase family protein [Virgisporangium ochraceum]|nr:L,D-transpeptidase family protein [Virgisporangium ochraceum]